MKRKYEIIYLTNLAAFYKINLLNAINKKRSILAIFIEADASDRNSDFFRGKCEFDFVTLTKSEFAKVTQLRKILRITSYNELIIGGWEGIVEIAAPYMSPKAKNSIVVESSHYESQTGGIKGMIKRLILKRVSKAYVPGIANAKLVDSLGFNGQVVTTHGVGVFNYQPQPIFKPRSDNSNRLLYVGRLSHEKNLKRLIGIVNKHPEWELTIVGFGPQEEELKTIAKNNVKFTGPIDNKALPAVYRSHDALVLPSTSETWGLVVEEALNNGLPVAVSERAGSAETWVADGKYGLTLDPFSEESIERTLCSILTAETNNRMRQNISSLNFEEIEQRQIECYLHSIEA